jgi:hypothetical protein
LRLSKDALQNLGQDLVLAAVGYSSPVRSLPKVPGLTDSGEKHSDSSSTSTIGDNPPAYVLPARKVVSVLQNNELIVSDHEDEEETSESFIKKVSHRLIGYNSSPQRAYKQGVTEYQFDNKANTRPSSLVSSKSVDGLSKVSRHRFSRSKIPVRSKSLPQRESLFDENGMPRCDSLDESIEFHIPSRAESFDSPTTPPGGSTESKPRGGKLSRKLGSSLRRSWSNFGPKLVNFMDHLLLDESKAKNNKKKTNPATNPPTSATSSSSVSSGSSSPPSVILKSDLAKTTAPARPPLRHSTTMSPCESSMSPTGLLHVQEILHSEQQGLIDINTEAANTDTSRVAPSGEGSRVVPSGDAHEHNW